jgi:xylulokinase
MTYGGANLSTVITTVVGIDVGTSGVKAIMVGLDGIVISEQTISYNFVMPYPGWAEQDAETWWEATQLAIRGLLSNVSEKNMFIEIAALSLTGQMHGLVPIRSDGTVIRPAILWCDLRSTNEANELAQNVGRIRIRAWTQNPPLPNFTLTKLLWMKQFEPYNFNQISKFVLPKDYVRYRLTGILSTDVSDASGTLLFDVANRKWSMDIAREMGIPVEWLPDVVESDEIVGNITREVSQLTGLKEGIPVIAGAADQAAGALGIGVIHAGQVAVSLGTSGVVLAPTERPVQDEIGALHTFCHALPNTWYVMGVTQSAGGSLKWFRDHLLSDIAKVSYDEIVTKADLISPGANGLLFLPYLIGERSPYLDPLAKGAWIGLHLQHTLGHMVRALLEGVAFSLNDSMEIITKELRLNVSEIKLTGGGGDSRLWRQILASVFSKPISLLHGSHGPAFGASMLAAFGSGLVHREDALSWVTMSSQINPLPDWEPMYSSLFPIYQQAYQQLQKLFHDLHHWGNTND